MNTVEYIQEEDGKAWGTCQGKSNAAINKKFTNRHLIFYGEDDETLQNFCRQEQEKIVSECFRRSAYMEPLRKMEKIASLDDFTAREAISQNYAILLNFT